jgi:hypothetical protein
LALCYYYSQRDKEAKGWIYLKDITKLVDDVKTFSIISAARTLVLEAKTTGEHTVWLQNLSSLCPLADSSSVRNLRSWSAGSKAEKDEEDKTDYAHLDSYSLKRINTAEPKVGGQLDRTASLFSRYAQGKRNSFYRERGLAVPAHSTGAEADELGTEIERVDLSSSSRDQSRSKGRGSVEREADEVGDRRELGRREKGRAIEARREQTRSREEENSGRRGSSENRDREDHRSRGHTMGNDSLGSTVSARLQKHIAKDPEAELEEVSMKMAHSNSRAREAMRTRRRQAADDSRAEDRSAEDGDGSDGEERVSDSIGARRAEPSILPRRARDSFTDESFRKPGATSARRTVEDFLAERSDSKAAESDEEPDDKSRESVKAQHPAKNKSKPPRPPQSQPPPYASIMSLQRHSHLPQSLQSHHDSPSSSGSARTGTPPRAAIHPGTSVDPNFATADWDNDEAVAADQYDSKIAEESRSVPSLGAGVRVDTNWLEEDFDS